MSLQPSPDEAAPGEIAATRRVVLAGVGATALVVLAGCATYDSSGGGAPAGGAPSDTDPTAADDPGETPAPVAQVADVPVGGGKILARQRMVITQPTAGTFKAFTAVCTHQGCLVGDVKGGTINCPCHGSSFHIADGSVANGPAVRPLRAIDITVDGGSIQLA